MNQNEQSFYSALAIEIVSAVVFWFVVAAIATYVVNRRRQTAGWAKVSLFFSIWGFTTLVPWLIALPAGHLALRQIRRSGGVLKGKAQAVIGLICGYGVVLIGIGMVVFALSYFTGEYQKLVKRKANILAIEKAKEAWASANNKSAQDTPIGKDIAPYMPNGKFPPPSIDGETYRVNAMNVKASVVLPPPPAP